MEPIFFETPTDFRRWLTENHDKAREVLVGYYKKHSGKPSMTWPQSVDEALCFGWIDGIRKTVDDASYTIRFTPRKARSIWSAVNSKRFGELQELGLVQPTGLAAFAKREENRSNVYSFEQETITLGEEFEQKFQENESAWTFFQAQPPSYRKACIWWVISAKQEATRRKRLDTLITTSAEGQRLSQFQRPTR